MLEDRFYLRREGFQPHRSATLLLVILNVVAFALQFAVPKFSRFPITDYFALGARGLHDFQLWQLLTFQFMHGGPVHLLLNCLAIYMLGREVEEALGRPRFLILYFSSGAIGGLVQALAGVLLENRFGGTVMGASAGAFGLAAAFAMLYPEQMLFLFAFIPMRAKYLLLLGAAVAIGGLVNPWQSPEGPHIAHAAHLGGMLAGMVFVRYAVHWHWPWPRFKQTRQPPIRRLVKVHPQKSAIWGRTEPDPVEDLPPEEFLAKEVDPILDKISAHGIQSLTARERSVLEAARTKIAKR
jgi:membrane associated rhomboid family serine protease